ncbi:sugar ABC transporter substrate-binding protein [Paracoccus sp. (in: a-proteobacteria)]|uniref:sugar ABC transporter substrate-binding protein n=1 Tax=Paracoccus sp. TaxID=267 RepID=UPI003A8747D2
MTTTKLAATALTAIWATIAAAQAQEPYRFTILTQTGIDNTFWQTIKRGMDDACAQYQVDCQLLFTPENGNLQMHLQNLETTIAQGVDGIATVIVDDNLYDDAIQRAIDADIPVLTLNVDDTQGAEGNARLAFVGQDLFQAGYEVAKGLVALLDKGQKQHVLLGLARPGESWAEQRIGGARKYLDEAIADGWDLDYQVIDSGNDLSITGQRICQYVQGNPATTAVIGAGFWFSGAGECLRDMGIQPHQIRMGGFDLVPILLDEMKKGYVDLTVDQQPYLQGYLPIQQLYFIKKYGLSAFDVNTGKALVSPEDVDQVTAFVEQGVR